METLRTMKTYKIFEEERKEEESLWGKEGTNKNKRENMRDETKTRRI